MGQKYNDFLLEAKRRYEKGDHSDVWDMVRKSAVSRPFYFVRIFVSNSVYIHVLSPAVLECVFADCRFLYRGGECAVPEMLTTGAIWDLTRA